MSANKRSESGFSIDKIADFCKKNVKYISAGVLTAAIVVILAVTAVKNKGGEEPGDKKPESQQEELAKDDSQETPEPADTADASGDSQDTAEPEDSTDNSGDTQTNPEVQQLLSTYYNSYAAGDVDKLSSLTRYLSDMEKDYISMMNEHVDSYNNVSCMVEEGRSPGDYIVSASYDMKFTGSKEALPGMNVFYIQTDQDGELYINNRYSSFNREMKEQKTKKKILNLIEEFENSAEVQVLQIEIQDKYDKIIDGDKDLEKVVNEVSEAIKKWKDSYTAPEEEPKEEPKPEEEPEQAPEETQQEPEETTDDDSDTAAGDDSSEGSSGLTYVPDGTVLTATDGYNVRVSMNESAELLGTTAVGDTIQVIMSYAEGWTKVEWNGITGYIRTDLLLAN